MQPTMGLGEIKKVNLLGSSERLQVMNKTIKFLEAIGSAPDSHEAAALTLKTTFQTIADLLYPDPSKPERTTNLVPAVPIDESVFVDKLICLEDGKVCRSLKRHLRSLGMTPDQYREKWGLPGNYPMVCSDYADLRSSIAKETRLGHHRNKGA